MTQKVPFPVWVRLMMIATVAHSVAAIPNMFQLNFHFIFQNFTSPGTKNLDFDAKMAQLPVWVGAELRFDNNFWRRVFKSFLQNFKTKFELL